MIPVDQPRLSLIIPAYNEASRIVPSLEKICAYLKGRYTYEILVVDDGSTDDTVAAVKKFAGSKTAWAAIAGCASACSDVSPRPRASSCAPP